MVLKNKSIEIDSLLFLKGASQKPPSFQHSILNVKSKLKNFCLEENKQNGSDSEIKQVFLEDEETSSTLPKITEIEKNIYAWLDERNIIQANPKEKLYAYFQKNRDKILIRQKMKKGNDAAQQKTEPKSFLNFTNSPLLMRRERKFTSIDNINDK